MAEDRPDLILMLGDYIYEDSWGDRLVRLFEPFEAVTLEDYRRRYTQYRTDPDLQAAHAACPWLVTWDDHEVDNDYVGLTGEHELCGGAAVRKAFPARRAAAYQAWFEHMPVRPSRLEPGMAVRIYGSVDWGRLARFYVLDTRQYRSVQVCPNPPTAERCDFIEWPQDSRSAARAARISSTRTHPTARPCSRIRRAPCSATHSSAGSTARSAESAAAWNVIAQNVMMMTIAEGTAESPRHYSDAWAGYPPARERLYAALAKHGTANPVVLTGDIHSFWVNDLANAAGKPVGVELVTSSIATSTYDKAARPAAQSATQIPRRAAQRLRALRTPRGQAARRNRDDRRSRRSAQRSQRRGVIRNHRGDPHAQRIAAELQSARACAGEVRRALRAAAGSRSERVRDRRANDGIPVGEAARHEASRTCVVPAEGVEPPT